MGSHAASVRPETPLQNVLSRLTNPKRSGRGWDSNCPCHPDQRASLSVEEADDGKILVKCGAGCETADILAKLGLQWSDLFPDSGSSRNGGREEIVGTYDYVDEDGELLYQAVRFFPKDFRQRRPDGNGSWTWTVKGCRRVLYRLPQVLEAVAQEKPIYLVEGEKDADRLAGLGLTATTNAMGAGKWSRSYSDALRGARVVILPDNDEAGRKHAGQVADELDGVAETVRIVRLPGLPEKGDVSDWLDAGHTLEEFLEVVEAGGEGEEEQRAFATLGELLARPELLEPPACVVPRLAFRGRATLLAGPDKCGKSTLMAHAVAHLTTGQRFLGSPMGLRHRRALWVGLEEAVGDAVRRFHDLGTAEDAVRLAVYPATDLLSRVDEALEESPVDLVVFDSLAEWARVTAGAAPDDGDAAGWGTIVRPVVALAARKHDAATVFLHHVRRSDGEYRGSGEIAAAVDLLLEMKPAGKGEDPTVRRLSGRGRWEVEGFAVALRDEQYELAAGTQLSRDALVLIHVEQNPGCSLNDVSKNVRGRKKAIADTVRELIARGAIENQGDGDEWALYPVRPQTELGVA